MLNQIVLVGRLVQDPEIKELENGMKTSYITLAVSRSYKNVNGEYDTDFIPVRLYKGIAENATEYCKKGDVIGVKGRIQRFCANDYTCNGYPILEIVAERVTFLQSRKETEEE